MAEYEQVPLNHHRTRIGNGTVSELDSESEREVTSHSHCQARTLGFEPYTAVGLEQLGYGVETNDVECCGMARSFGYKSDYYDRNVSVDESAVEKLPRGLVVASGASCGEQFGSLAKLSITHLVQLLTCSIE